nr:MAG TPA: hypothetical protein [Caudoviricetes sp.]
MFHTLNKCSSLCIHQSNRQRIQGNEVSAIGKRKGDAEAANLINIAKK